METRQDILDSTLTEAAKDTAKLLGDFVFVCNTRDAVDLKDPFSGLGEDEKESLVSTIQKYRENCHQLEKMLAELKLTKRIGPIEVPEENTD